MMTCPSCGQANRLAVPRCKRCGRDLVARPRGGITVRRSDDWTMRMIKWSFGLVLALVLVIMVGDQLR
jgi:uncharacterized membrane protein YvbJ